MSQELSFSDFEWLSDAGSAKLRPHLRATTGCIQCDSWTQRLGIYESWHGSSLPTAPWTHQLGWTSNQTRRTCLRSISSIQQTSTTAMIITRLRRSCWRSKRRCSRRISCVCGDSNMATANRLVESLCARSSQKCNTLCSARR